MACACSSRSRHSQALRSEDAAQQREAAAARLFDVPLYRELATREIYEALGTLPDAQRRQLSAALRDPKVVQALKQAILRSTAATYSVKEIELVHRFPRGGRGALDHEQARSLPRCVVEGSSRGCASLNPDLAPALPQQ